MNKNCERCICKLSARFICSKVDLSSASSSCRRPPRLSLRRVRAQVRRRRAAREAAFRSPPLPRVLPADLSESMRWRARASDGERPRWRPPLLATVAAARDGRRSSRRQDAAVGIAAAAAAAAIAAATSDKPNVGANRANVAHRPHARFSAATIAHHVVAILSGDSFGRRIFVSTAIFESLGHRCALSHAASVFIWQRGRR